MPRCTTRVVALESAAWPATDLELRAPGHESRHNLRIGANLPYAGFGPSAASYVDGMRWTNPRRFSDYEAAARAGFRRSRRSRSTGRRAGRPSSSGSTAQGVDSCPRGALWPCGGCGAGGRLERAVRSGLALRDGSRVRLTGAGFLIADELFVDLL